MSDFAADDKKIRAIVFKEGDLYVGQCLEYDICAQAPDIEALLARLDLTVEAEFATCRQQGKTPRDLIAEAPAYYHDLWDKRSIGLHRVSVSSSAAQRVEAALVAA